MLIAPGDYRYEIRRDGSVLALEQERYIAGGITGSRRTVDGANLHEVEATLAPDETIKRVSVRYNRGLFKRSAVYDAADETLRGSVSAVASHNEVVVKLGRFREIDADLVLFRALILAHVRARGQLRWTGRVAIIDPHTLVAAALKQNCRSRDQAGLRWTWEARMGDADEIELDSAGKITRQRDSWGVEKILVDFVPIES
ncbi:MAG TPA: hypothetical protein VHS07_05430 [Candidatus Binataceae bacterium]|jgi:hypothetical protein|nr:hypothetical protein [Candidatus Binataceae bacterium]